MLRRVGGYMSVEALALISALCIVGIFFYAHYARQASWHDHGIHFAQSMPSPWR